MMTKNVGKRESEPENMCFISKFYRSKCLTELTKPTMI